MGNHGEPMDEEHDKSMGLMNLGYHQQLGGINWGAATMHACVHYVCLFSWEPIYINL